MGYYYGFKPYVPVAKRRAQAAREVSKRIKKGQAVSPVLIQGRAIATTFWGKAWCTNLEGYGDFANRLPRGRTYARNGSVVHLTISKGRIEALVSGSELYEIQIDIAALSKDDWRALKEQSAGKIGTLVELLQGKLSSAVMELVTDRDQGLFPKPREIKMRCSCPDYAGMCKHIAAVMYGIGHRLDSSPDLLFVLRGVDHLELIEQAIPTAPLKTKSKAATISAGDLGAIFDIEIGDDEGAKADEMTGVTERSKKITKKRAALIQATDADVSPGTPESSPSISVAKKHAAKKGAVKAKAKVADLAASKKAKKDQTAVKQTAGRKTLAKAVSKAK
jgi:uncharacterized Zn finger protein